MDQRHALANGQVVELSPAMAVILQTLSRRAPMPVMVSALMDAVWGAREEPDSADNMVSVHIHRIRKVIGKLGYDIETRKGSYRLNERAYRLVKQGTVQ